MNNSNIIVHCGQVYNLCFKALHGAKDQMWTLSNNLLFMLCDIVFQLSSIN